MPSPTFDQIVFRFGAREFARGGRLLGLQRDDLGLVVPAPGFARPDASTCATALGRDGKPRLWLANRLRVEYVDLDGDGIRETPGILIEGTRTNLIENSSCEADVVGWAANVSTLVRDGTNTYLGAWAAKVTTQNSTSSGVFVHNRAGTRIPVTVGTQYAWSVPVFAPAGSVGKTMKVRIEWWSAAPAFLSATEVTGQVLVAGWQRLWVSGVAPASAATADCFIGGDNAQGIWDFWADLPQFEVGNFPSSPIPTSTGAVTRANDDLTAMIALEASVDYTVLAQVARPIYAGVDPGIAPGILSLGNSTPCAQLHFVQSPTFGGATQIRDGTTIQSATANFGAEKLVSLCAQYKNLLVAGRTNIDVGGGVTADSAAAQPIKSFAGNKVQLGLRVGATHYLFGGLVNVVMAKGLFTKAEMEAVA